MHDYFDILGLPTNAGATEVRRAWARRARRSHPDFCDPATGTVAVIPPAVATVSMSSDLAIDFVDMTTLVEGIQAAFFKTQTSG